MKGSSKYKHNLENADTHKYNHLHTICVRSTHQTDTLRSFHIKTNIQTRSKWAEAVLFHITLYKSGNNTVRA